MKQNDEEKNKRKKHAISPNTDNWLVSLWLTGEIVCHPSHPQSTASFCSLWLLMPKKPLLSTEKQAPSACISDSQNIYIYIFFCKSLRAGTAIIHSIIPFTLSSSLPAFLDNFPGITWKMPNLLVHLNWLSWPESKEMVLRLIDELPSLKRSLSLPQPLQAFPTLNTVPKLVQV